MKTNNKGITMIALVVTIVIMAILAGVTIQVVIKGNLFNETKNIINEYENYTSDKISKANGIFNYIDIKEQTSEIIYDRWYVSEDGNEFIKFNIDHTRKQYTKGEGWKDKVEENDLNTIDFLTQDYLLLGNNLQITTNGTNLDWNENEASFFASANITLRAINQETQEQEVEISLDGTYEYRWRGNKLYFYTTGGLTNPETGEYQAEEQRETYILTDLSDDDLPYSWDVGFSSVLSRVANLQELGDTYISIPTNPDGTQGIITENFEFQFIMEEGYRNVSINEIKIGDTTLIENQDYVVVNNKLTILSTINNKINIKFNAKL